MKSTSSTKEKELIIVLEQPYAGGNLRTLVIGRIDGRNELLNLDDHKQYIESKLKKSAEKFRPDILHRSILSVFDSPLSKAGLTKVFIHTSDKKVISIDPSMRVNEADSRSPELTKDSTDFLSRS